MWTGTLPGGLFRSADFGTSWQLVEALWNDPTRPGWFGGGYDAPGIHSLCPHPNRAGELLIGGTGSGLGPLQRVIDGLRDQGCDAVVLGCTELPLIIHPEDSPIPTFDTTALHALAAVEFSLAN